MITDVTDLLGNQKLEVPRLRSANARLSWARKSPPLRQAPANMCLGAENQEVSIIPGVEDQEALRPVGDISGE